MRILLVWPTLRVLAAFSTLTGMVSTLSLPAEFDPAWLQARESREHLDQWETAGRVDRRRVLYSREFHRLVGITQVAAPELGAAHLHNRLTHSLKVADVAGRIAGRVMSSDGLSGAASQMASALDIDAVEAAALAHDLGHPPFGHVAEAVLGRMASEAGIDGFEGNAQTFRILTRLAMDPGSSRGLNLTRQTLGGTIKYPWLRSPEQQGRDTKWAAYYSDGSSFEWARYGLSAGRRTLEAEIVDWADDVTYAIHDMTDFFVAGLVPLERLSSEERERRRFVADFQDIDPARSDRLSATAEKLFTGSFAFLDPHEPGHARVLLKRVTDGLIDRYVTAFRLRPASAEDALVEIEAEARDEVDVLKRLIWHYVIDRPALAVKQDGERKIIAGLFTRFVAAASKHEYSLLPPSVTERVKGAETPSAEIRVVVDYIAGLTESGARTLYGQLMGTTPGSVMGGVE